MKNGFRAGSVLRLAPVAALAGVSLAVAWRTEGSIAGRDWLGYAVLVALLLVAVAAAAVRRPSPPALVALGALLLFALWLGLSSIWSPLPTLAREEALLALFYACVLAVTVIALRGEEDRLAALWLLVAVSGGTALAAGLVLWIDPDPATMLEAGRLFYPVTYTNAQAAFFLIGFWPAVALAARRAAPLVARTVALAAATAMLAGWLVTQSKGALAGLAVSAAVLALLSPLRLRLAVATTVAAVPVAALAVPLTGTFRADDADAMRTAGLALLAAAAAGTVLGLAYAAADRRIELSERIRRLAGRAGLAAAVAAVAAGIALFVAAGPSDLWREFKTLPYQETGVSHLENLGSNRYDFWRVALVEFRDHPVAGIGARGWSAAYLREGESPQTPARSHSVFLDALAENGIVGLLLLLVAVGVPLLAAARRAATFPAAAALGGGASWLAHASVDWTWTLPAAGIPFFLLLGIALSHGGGPRLGARASSLAAAAAAVVALLVLAPAWLSERFSSAALAEPGPAAATDLRWARRLNPVSVTPYLVQAQIASSAAEAIPPLEKAAELEPRSVAVRFLLGLRYREAGREAEAREELEAALALWPDAEPILRALRDAD